MEQIESVFVRSTGMLDPADWSLSDLNYMQAEFHAALLAWLTALECPVINRVPAELWYRSRLPLLHWLAPLRSCGLRVPDTIISSEPSKLEEYRADAESNGTGGAVFQSLVQQNSWLVWPEDWMGVAELSKHAPVCLSEPHGSVSLLCVVGRTIVWNHEPSADEAALSDQLVRFASLTGLDFVEVGLASVHAGIAVVHVDLLPRLERFTSAAREEIVDRLAMLLLCPAGQASEVLQ